MIKKQKNYYKKNTINNSGILVLENKTFFKGIGLGYVQKGFTKRDTEIFVQVRKKQISAKVIRLPFYKGWSLSAIKKDRPFGQS